MKNALSLLALFCAGVSFSQSTSAPELVEIKENPSENYYRTYHVRKDAPDTLYGAFEERYKGVIITKGGYKNNQPDGKWILTGMNNKPEMLIHFDRGIRHGEFIRYFKSGDTAISCSYIQGKLDGLKQEFSAGGQLMFYGKYKNGDPEGKLTWFHKNGVVMYTLPFENGKKHGTYQRFYETGTLAEEGIYKEGKLEGLYKEYYPSGALRLSVEYKNGTEWSLLSHLKKNGEEHGQPGKLTNGNGTITVFNNDELIEYTLTVKNGRYEGLAKYYYNGKLQREVMYSEGMKNGAETRYRQEQKTSEEHYTRDTLDGPSVDYWNGKITWAREYDMGKMVKGSLKKYASDGSFTIVEDELTGHLTVENNNTRVFPDENTRHHSEAFSFAEEMPEFIDGGFTLYLVQNVKYPAEAKKKHKEGTVYVSFVVNKFGFIQDVKIAKGIPGAPELDEEAMRVIAAMPRWSPGTMNGEPVKITITQPIKFVLGRR